MMTLSMNEFRRQVNFWIKHGGITMQVDGAAVDLEDEARPLFAIIDAMTKEERESPDIIDGARRRRIAAGAGVDPLKVTQFFSEFQKLRHFKASLDN